MNFLELPLFQSLSDQELEQMKTSGCLRTASYKKNEYYNFLPVPLFLKSALFYPEA